MQETAPQIVRRLESEYTRGSITQSKYVNFDMWDTINRIEAYLNSKHTSGETDSLGREKPFFNSEREFIRDCKRAQEPFPVKKIQIRFPPKSKK